MCGNFLCNTSDIKAVARLENDCQWQKHRSVADSSLPHVPTVIAVRNSHLQESPAPGSDKQSACLGRVTREQLNLLPRNCVSRLKTETCDSVSGHGNQQDGKERELSKHRRFIHHFALPGHGSNRLPATGMPLHPERL